MVRAVMMMVITDPQPEEEHPLADFEAFARRRPQEDFTRVDFLDSLTVICTCRRFGIVPEIWDQMKAENPTTQAVTSSSDGDGDGDGNSNSLGHANDYNYDYDYD